MSDPIYPAQRPTPRALGAASEDVVLRGVVASGVGKASGFTQLPWVMDQFATRLALRVWPGTFNLRVGDASSQALWERVQAWGGIALDPPEAGACVARCYVVDVNERVRGAIVLPHVPGYAPDQIEVVAEESIRERLGLADGDSVLLRVFAGRGSRG